MMRQTVCSLAPAESDAGVVTSASPFVRRLFAGTGIAAVTGCAPSGDPLLFGAVGLAVGVALGAGLWRVVLSSRRATHAASAHPPADSPPAAFAAIAQATNDAVWEYDCARNELWWSDGAAKLFGDAPRTTLHDWLQAVHPEDRTRLERRFHAVREGHVTEWADEYRVRRADGSYADVSDRGAALAAPHGPVTRMFGGLRDVSEQKLARVELRRINELLRSLASQYQAVVEQSIAGIMVLQNDRFRYVNPKFADMCGAHPQDLLAMPSAIHSVHEDDRPHAAEALARRMEGELAGGPTRVRWKRPDGTLTWGEVHGSRIEYEGAPALLGVAVDITDRQRAEAVQQQLLDQLLSARERLQGLTRQLMHVQEEERRQLARDLHDEIGQALTALKMNLHTMSFAPSPTTAASHAPSAQDTKQDAKTDSLRILDELIAHVRNLSLDLRPAMLDDLGLPETLRWFIARQAGRAGWATTVEVDDALSELPSGLALTCFRVVQESLTNAMRHAQATQIAVSARRTEQGVLLDIRDNGIGFDVAGAFQRGSRGGSVGLLSLQERVRALGGELQLESRATRGTTITVRLPLSTSS